MLASTFVGFLFLYCPKNEMFAGMRTCECARTLAYKSELCPTGSVMKLLNLPTGSRIGRCTVLCHANDLLPFFYVSPINTLARSSQDLHFHAACLPAQSNLGVARASHTKGVKIRCVKLGKGPILDR